jgi:hypothetical protein
MNIQALEVRSEVCLPRCDCVKRALKRCLHALVVPALNKAFADVGVGSVEPEKRALLRYEEARFY